MRIPEISTLELLVLSLTVFVIFAMILEIIIPVNSEMLKLLRWYDYICSFIFISEWFIRLKHSINKFRFIIFNFIDLIASLPLMYMPILKSLRLIKIFPIIRLFGSLNRLRTYTKLNTFKVARTILFLLFVLLSLISPILILYFESELGSINTAENALWWTYCTITTIGYGDLYPVTTGGRIFTVLVSIGGIGMFGIISSMIINYIIKLNNEKS